MSRTVACHPVSDLFKIIINACELSGPLLQLNASMTNQGNSVIRQLQLDDYNKGASTALYIVAGSVSLRATDHCSLLQAF